MAAPPKACDTKKLCCLGAGLGGDGLGGVGVEFVDYFSILLFNYAALQFQGEGQAAVVEGEIFGGQSEALDGFPLRDVRGETLHFGFDARAAGGVAVPFVVEAETRA